MELFVVLLAIGFSSSEKLNLGYLPPSGAFLAGGSSDDLQTPLEYKDLAFNINDNQSTFKDDIPQTIAKDIRNQESLIDTESSDGKGISVSKAPSEFTQTPIDYSIVNTEGTTIPEIGYDANIQRHFDKTPGYPTVSTAEGNDENGYHFGIPENMPILAVSKGIVGIYNPNAFGMYGGNPMIVKSKLHNMYKEPEDYPSNDLYTTDQLDHGSQHIMPVTLNHESREETYQSTIKPVTTNAIANSILKQRKKIQNKRRPQAESDRTASVINYKNIINPNGYAYNFDTSNGIHIDEIATTSDGNKASGSYSYTGDDGKVYSIVYTADENGFQPKGDHLPKAPPIPNAIQRLIEQAKKDKANGIFNDGSYDEEKYGHMRYEGPVERYLQKINVNFKPRNRNRVKNFKEVHRKHILMPKQTEKSRVNQEIVANTNQRIVNDINERFGMRNVAVKENTNQFSESRVKNTIKNNRIFFSDITPISKHNFYDVNSREHINMYNKDPGYYYVPPRQIFVEGKHQDQPIHFKNINKFSTFSENSKTGSLSQSYYYVNHRNQSQNLFDDLTTTVPELNLQTTGIYENTNQDHNLNTNEKALKTANGVITTSKPYNTLSTNGCKIENTNDYEEETIYTERQDAVSIGKESEFIYSTTPMPSQAKLADLGDSKDFQGQFDDEKVNQKYSTDEGYLVTKPDVQIFFDDFPSSTYSPISTLSEIPTEGVFNIKVDGFGRPIEDSQQYYNTNSYTELPNGNDEGRQTAYNNFGGANKDNDDTTVSKDFNEEGETKTKGLEDNNKIKGENFSGPKQQQRYDSTFGYFY